MLAAPYILGTSDFDAQMSGIKFWKGDENLRPVFFLIYIFEISMKGRIFLYPIRYFCKKKKFSTLRRDSSEYFLRT
jgi:hypothetical protein